jgi:antitoxin component YwqK of YwqJK toxin-antitoxin module
MKKRVFGICLLCFVLFCKLSGQTDTATYYFNEALQTLESKKGADYIGKAYRENALWKLVISNRQTHKIILKAFYSDSTLHFLNGVYETYFDNGLPKMFGNYHAGLEDSLWRTWNEKNVLIDSAIYKDGEILFHENRGYNDKGILISYQFNDAIKKKREYKNYYSSGKLKDESEWLDKQGELRIYYETGVLAELATYDETGKRVSWHHYNENGIEISEKEYNTLREQSLKEYQKQLKSNTPEFRGGEAEFSMFMQRNLKLPSGYTNTVHQVQTISFSFRLDEKGRAYDIKMISPQDVELERAVKEMLGRMPRWDMKGLASYGPLVHSVRITY